MFQKMNQWSAFPRARGDSCVIVAVAMLLAFTLLGSAGAQTVNYYVTSASVNIGANTSGQCNVTGQYPSWDAAAAAAVAACNAAFGNNPNNIGPLTVASDSFLKSNGFSDFGVCTAPVAGGLSAWMVNGQTLGGGIIMSCSNTPIAPFAFTKDVGTSCDKKSDGQCGDPIVMAAGNKILAELDFVAPGQNSLKFQRYYNSAPVASAATNFAQGLMHNYATSVAAVSSTSATVSRSDGKSYTFNLVGGTWTPDADVSDSLVQLTSGSTVTGWQYTNASDDSLETYDAYGNLSSIAYREGTTVTLAYANESTVPALLSVTDSFGKKLTFSANGNVKTMTDPNGENYTYTLGSTGAVSSLTYPDTTSKTYLYDESAYTGGLNFPLVLTGVMDENNSRYESTWYGSSGAAIETALAGGVGNYTITDTLDPTGRIQSVSLQNALGATGGRGFTSLLGRNRLSSVSLPAANGQPAGSKAFSFDANGNIIESTDLNGNVQCSVYDLTRNLETGRVEGMAPGSPCPSNISTYVPTAGTVQRKTLTQYHSIWHLPAQRAEPLKITAWTYNGDGGVYCAPTTAMVGSHPIGVVCSRSEQATTDATGGSGFGATASGFPRLWSYTYNAFGQVLTAKGPRTDVNQTTTYAYYSCATGGKCGQIDTITDALGHVTTFLTYDGNGHPLTISDPNGVVTTLTYDGRQRLTSLQVGTETTSYSYYATGLLKRVTLPDSSTITNTYDTAHRLTKITDGLGNYIKYTLDAAGNRTATDAYDSNSNLKRAHTAVYNTLSSLYQDINAAGTSAVTTTYGYDAQGNRTSVAAPQSRDTSNAFDALDRLDQITDPAGGITKFAYDGHDNLVSVIDPRTLTTAYTADGFGEVTQLASPDTETSGKTYDLAGNVETTTDARGAVGNYTYDALNRVTQIVYPDQTIKFTYDVGTNGKGRLTGASDANHSISWTYDTQGQITGKGQTVATVTKSVGYGYTNNDLTSIATPSGQTIAYTYKNHEVTSIKVNSTTLLSSVTYDPFGPATGWTWGNSSTESRTYTEDGNPNQIIAAGVTNTYTVDNASRITGISDSGLSSNSLTFGYDLLDRVTSGTSSALNHGYTYDANGNRLTETGTLAFTAKITTTDNQIASTRGGLARTYGYDTAGNTTSYTGASFTFNDRGRMSTAVIGSGTTNYVYNALGQLIEKSGNGGTTLVVYDESGHLLGEYSSTGTLIQETVWMGDVPVATLRPNGSAITIYYVHADQLGTPRKITNPSDNAVVWRWDPDTFGTATPSVATIAYNLRFPGQYYLPESGLYYNYFRDYDPQTGRYLESDPIGLAGGSYSTYSYTNNNPISWSDPSGLQTAPTLPIGPGPLIIPPVAIPGTPENKQFVDAAMGAIDQIKAAAQQAAQALTGANCPNGDECNRLNQNVQNAKNRVGSLGACRAGMTTSQLTERYYAWLDLATARSKRDQKCFSGGDSGHQDAQAQAWSNVGSCGNLLGR